MRKDVKDFIRTLEDRGWYLRRKAGSGHFVLFYKPGGSITVPATPSDYRWKLNCQTDAHKVEIKYGPYTKPVIKHISDTVKGLAYSKVTQPIITQQIPQQILTEEIVEEVNIQINHQPPERYVMTPEDRKVMISALKERATSLKKQLAPYMSIFDEYEHVEKLIHNMQREDDPDKKKVENEKVTDFLKTKGVTKLREKIDSDEFYNDICKIVMSHNGRMNLQDLYEWLRDVRGYNLGYTSGDITTSPTSDIVKRICLYNKTNPIQITLGPEKLPEQKRVRAYEYILYVGSDRAAIAS